MKRKYYKVVRVTKLENEKQSAVAENYAKVIYKVNEWAYPPDWLEKIGYGILLFNNLENAKWFYYNNTLIGGEIWECEIGKEIKLPPFSNVFDLSDKRIITAYRWDSLLYFPLGTICADKIKLTRKVKSYGEK